MAGNKRGAARAYLGILAFGLVAFLVGSATIQFGWKGAIGAVGVIVCFCASIWAIFWADL